MWLQNNIAQGSWLFKVCHLGLGTAIIDKWSSYSIKLLYRVFLNGCCAWERTFCMIEEGHLQWAMSHEGTRTTKQDLEQDSFTVKTWHCNALQRAFFSRTAPKSRPQDSRSWAQDPGMGFQNSFPKSWIQFKCVAVGFSHKKCSNYYFRVSAAQDSCVNVYMHIIDIWHVTDEVLGLNKYWIHI